MANDYHCDEYCWRNNAEHYLLPRRELSILERLNPNLHKFFHNIYMFSE